jgi:uncharacterized membrane-anchored protein
LADQPEPDQIAPGLQSTSFLTDAEVGATKTSSPLLSSVSRLNRPALAAAVGLQLFILVAMIVGRSVPYIGAQSVLLRVEPIDPRDLFRGDYVTLSYAFTRIPSGNFQPGDSVYVTLVPEQSKRHYIAHEFLHNPPSAGLYIRGVAQTNGRANFGIESYYVQEGTGHAYEAAVRSRRLWAEVALDNQGNPALQSLVIE